MSFVTVHLCLIVIIAFMAFSSAFRVPMRPALVSASSKPATIQYPNKALLMSSPGAGNGLDDQTKAKIENVINSNKVVLFMKV
jgi:hypothetical protein